MEAPNSPQSVSEERRADGVVVLRLDVPGEALNTLKYGFAAELTATLERVSQWPPLKAVVFTSGKPDGFIAGADIRMLRAVERAAQGTELSLAGQRALAMLAGFRVPVVAAIHGACLGGGLELALACTARVATTDEKTKLGLPEVQLGLLPGLGGTQRLPRLIGLQPALDLLLTGKQVNGKRALQLALIDDLVPSSILLDAAVRLALSRAASPRVRPGSARRWLASARFSQLVWAENPLGRRLLFDQAKKRLLSKTHGNYPANERILEVVKLGLAEGVEHGLLAEANGFGELVVSAPARALMHVFFANTEAKKDTGIDEDSRAAVEPRAVRKLAVIGAGSLGAGVAYVSAARAKVAVRLKDRDEPALGRGLKYVRAILDERVDAGRLGPTERDLCMARVTASTDYEGIDAAELVIEAVIEDLDSKRQVLAEAEHHSGKNTIFAANASSFPIAEIARAARRPEQVIGMHYFEPVHETPLLEVVVTQRTAAWVTASCVAFGKQQGKTVIVVRDGAGFYTSRILAPYLSEACSLLAEGVTVDAIDQALVKWGFPVGPFTLLDEIGIDVGDEVAQVLLGAFGDRMAQPSGIDGLLKDHRLGKKNQRGFYDYGEQRKRGRSVDRTVYAVLGVEPGRELPQSEIAQRCVLRMANEAAHCFGEGILRSARDGDLGAVLGLGFPPFLGGPFYYADELGAGELVRRLESYRDTLGTRFAPAPVLVELASSGATFYGPRAVNAGQHQG